ESEDDGGRSARGSDSSDTDEEELHHRIRVKQDAFRRKEQEMQEKLTQETLLARAANTSLSHDQGRHPHPIEANAEEHSRRLDLGLKATSVCGAVQRAASRSGFSWAAVCKQRALWQQRSVCTGMQRTGYLAEPSGWWVG
ncbi:hypothetical protein XENOCAPTIV_010104, partial [Xenoophorus captivus]